MYKNKLSVIIVPALIGLALALGLVAGIYLGSHKAGRISASPGPSRAQDKLNFTLSLIDKMYVDMVNMDSIREHLIPYVIDELDPHSAYIPASELAEANEALDGEFDGIGVVFNMITDTVVVLNVIPFGPSDKAGVKAGDRIMTINDSLVAGRKIAQNDIVKQLRGPRGTKVKLGLERYGIKGLVHVTVERGKIPLKSIDAAFMIEPGVAFMKLSAFSRNSHTEMMAALDKLKNEGMKSLVFDLRGNSGGYLDQAILLANEFLPDGDMIVYTLDRQRKRTEEFSHGGKYTDLPLAILIDEGSASSSEILAGAIQDNDRGTIIGRRSYGKGLVQQQFMYNDASALRLTIARYYTPTGRSIQKPYINGGRKEYEHDLHNRFAHNEFFSADSIKFTDSLKFTTPGGRTVYGGGGIMPDLFIPLDTTDMTQYYLQVSGRNILYRYVLEYTDRYRSQLETIKTLPELKVFLDRDRLLFDNFIKYATAHGITPNQPQIEKSKILITAQIRALVGRNTHFEDNAFYYLIRPVDPVVDTAVKELK